MHNYFRNVQNDGNWEIGGTYTFDYYIQHADCTETYDPEACGPGCPLCLRFDYSGYARFLCEDDDDYFLFDNNNQDATGGVPYLTIVRYGPYLTDEPLDGQEIEGDEGWWRRTVIVNGLSALGTYYLKHHSFQVPTPYYECLEGG